ncbi:S-(hydroxymethyl)glutathione dehydrogenase/alcohol dehydrogenase [Actinocorallia herbida]|uniref:S-(Hydroxymethyl)glutathione dehydrogenase/alcohol dehydrogenase n=1 Tax=Actinocorallia herbida TaxID=58109 RepID=A0A3N1DBE6_9ACTN|nr:NDMA-dependent alcohol dehydrogenase [Actinocorallia herbida]ROO90796.1 S-(hydroxymethyl)glutathione dehydrogenase/alcohol dehydrogenase [Actinocorallia herbida]
MKARAAMLLEQPGTWQVKDVELDEPGYGEVLVEMVSTGLCHSDDHMAVNDIPVAHLPFCGGHEGSGVVRQVGPGVTDLKEGDHVITSFVPACGRCKWCAQGLQVLCDNGAKMLEGSQMDGTFRMHYEGQDVATGGLLGTFANWQVYDQLSVIKIRQDVPLNVACLIACGVPTGWGSAVNGGQVKPGDVVIVMGVGGIGINAVQGAKHAGAARIIACDPVEFKREVALKVGATDGVADIHEAGDLARSLTNGQGADSTIVTVGVITGQNVGDALTTVRKAGTVVSTAQGPADVVDVPISLFELSMMQKRIQGVLYGMDAPRLSVPRLLDLYAEGILKLDELVTRRYKLEDINQAYADMHAGVNIRGVIDFQA